MTNSRGPLYLCWQLKNFKVDISIIIIQVTRKTIPWNRAEIKHFVILPFLTFFKDVNLMKNSWLKRLWLWLMTTRSICTKAGFLLNLFSKFGGSKIRIFGGNSEGFCNIYKVVEKKINWAQNWHFAELLHPTVVVALTSLHKTKGLHLFEHTW